MNDAALALERPALDREALLRPWVNHALYTPMVTMLDYLESDQVAANTKLEWLERLTTVARCDVNQAFELSRYLVGAVPHLLEIRYRQDGTNDYFTSAEVLALMRDPSKAWRRDWERYMLVEYWSGLKTNLSTKVGAPDGV